MPLTQANAITQVRARIDEEDPASGFVSDAQIRVWLNEGQREVARRSNWKRTDTTISVTAGTQYYVAPSAVIQILRLEFKPTGSTQVYPLEYVEINAMDVVWGTGQTQRTGIPDTYTLVSANPLSIQLFPTPSQNGNLKLYYYSMPTDLATADTSDANDPLDVPTGWEDLVVEYASAEAFRKARDMPSFQMAMAAFDRKLNRLLETSVQSTVAPGYIVDVWDWSDWF